MWTIYLLLGIAVFGLLLLPTFEVDRWDRRN
jgi:hypothetical protein